MNKLLLAAALVLLTACGSNVNYVSIIDLPQQYWKSSEFMEFDFNQEGTEQPQTIYMLVRHTPDFQYERLFLEVQTTTPSNKYWCDSVSIKLADREKKWIGKDMTTHFDVTSIYRKGAKFEEKGDYKMKIRYYFPADSLEGIKALGLTIEKDGKK